MIRVGSIDAEAQRIAATIRGVRANLAGYRRAVIHLDARNDGTDNERVLGYLLRANPGLGRGLDAAARASVSRDWKGAQSTLANMTFHAGMGLAHELAARLRSGRYVTNTEETSARKARRGRGMTPGLDTSQLATALENARVTVE
jgi:hypothetical protein